MNQEILKDVAMSNSIGSTAGRTLRVPDLLAADPRTVTSVPEESLVIDDRCDVTPAQMVESKLTRVLGGSTLLVSHLQMRGLLRRR